MSTILINNIQSPDAYVLRMDHTCSQCQGEIKVRRCEYMGMFKIVCDPCYSKMEERYEKLKQEMRSNLGKSIQEMITGEEEKRNKTSDI